MGTWWNPRFIRIGWPFLCYEWKICLFDVMSRIKLTEMRAIQMKWVSLRPRIRIFNMWKTLFLAPSIVKLCDGTIKCQSMRLFPFDCRFIFGLCSLGNSQSITSECTCRCRKWERIQYDNVRPFSWSFLLHHDHHWPLTNTINIAIPTIC